jgi:RecJ-like exonuclease
VKTCPDCNGDGVIEKGTDDERQCPTCGGSGFVPDDDEDEEVIRTAIVEAAAGRANVPFAVPPDIASHLVSGIEAATLDEAFREAERHRSVVSPRAGG